MENKQCAFFRFCLLSMRGGGGGNGGGGGGDDLMAGSEDVRLDMTCNP